MKLIVAGTRPPDYIVKNVKKYAEWLVRLSNSGITEQVMHDSSAVGLVDEFYTDEKGITCGHYDERGFRRRGPVLLLSYTDEDLKALSTVKYPYYTVEEIVSGVAYGADHLGEVMAGMYGIPVRRFNADWKTHGKSAGMIRNREMADYADVLYLVWDGKSTGSKNMKDEMIKRNKPVHELVIEDWTLGVK